MAVKSAFHETYVRAAGAVAFLAIIDANEDESIGSAFHIGDGIFVTGRHVIDGVTIKEISTTKSAHLAEEVGGKAEPPRRLEIADGSYFGPDGLNVAVFRGDLGGTPLPAITASQLTDYELGENDLVISDISSSAMSAMASRAGAQADHPAIVHCDTDEREGGANWA